MRRNSDRIDCWCGRIVNTVVVDVGIIRDVGGAAEAAFRCGVVGLNVVCA